MWYNVTQILTERKESEKKGTDEFCKVKKRNLTGRVMPVKQEILNKSDFFDIFWVKKKAF